MRVPGSNPSTIAHGFVAPTPQDVYLAQSHLDGAGINLAAIPSGEISDSLRRFYRGLILAVDRDNNRGALASRLVIVRSENAEKLIGTMGRKQFEAAFGAGEEELVRDIADYLQPGKESILRAPLDDGENRVEIHNWGELREYVERPKIAKYLRESEGRIHQ